MKRLLYRHCLACCEDISYGVEPEPGETEAQANLREFGVASEDDALANATFKYASIDDGSDAFLEGRFVRLIFDVPWEGEHGCQFVLRDGKLPEHVGASGDPVEAFV
ncbi:hypothetical protein HMI49_10130 [Corallococcus exercitus]|uniref:DUF6985 domain-containing protein n=1 Tax=Corallococcus exercitus TaxID=2316736 RepID=A0A7Y4KH07_9BACT|nr:hypothetical protein [Corallococcus exercitus]NOK33556.1 hypothetical protein [Corallococcus exercitus]